MSSTRSVVLAALLLTANAAALRPTPSSASSSSDSCKLQVSQSGTASVDVDPDQLVFSVSVKSPVASEAGESAHKMKAIVDAVYGSKYTQTFSQDSHWDSKSRKTVKGDWTATGTVTLPIVAKTWVDCILPVDRCSTGSDQVSSLINQLLALTSVTRPQQGTDMEKDKGYDDESNGYAEPHAGYRRRRHLGQSPGTDVTVSIESMFFSVSDEVRQGAEKQALSLAVTDAISRIAEAAAPFRPPAPYMGDDDVAAAIDSQNLSQVRVSNGGSGSYRLMGSSRNFAAAPMLDSGSVGAASAKGAVEAADLTYAVPQKQPVPQTVSVSACVNF